MAINRVLAAIWSEISARGSLIKTATNPYHPNPGADNPNANNQGLAAITGGSPFLPLTQDGLNPEVPVATNLGDGAKLSPSGALDENSGAYHVTRQYGDIYLYNDGNIIAWGGNGKNFSFGNGYEENHAWANQPAVYNNEKFQIPNGAMSLFTDADTYALLPSTPPDNSWEWLGGNVSKSWGNDYTYTYGSSYEWSGGPTQYVDAFGNTGDDLRAEIKGKHCTFSYGTGYEESLVSWPANINNGGPWYHADDTNSPYFGRKHDDWTSSYLSVETVASSFAGSAAQALAPLAGLVGADEAEEMADTLSEQQAAADNAQDFAARNTWTAANLLVGKTFGNTYDYQCGAALSIQEGPSEERVHGNSSSSVIGNSVESVTGNSTSTVTGNSDETVTGNATSMVQGNSTDQYWGGQAEFFMGGQSSMSLAACDEINLSATIAIVGGAATEIFLGAKMELVLAAALEIKGGTALNITAGAVVEMNLNKVEVAVADVKTRSASISTSIMKLFV